MSLSTSSTNVVLYILLIAFLKSHSGEYVIAVSICRLFYYV